MLRRLTLLMILLCAAWPAAAAERLAQPFNLVAEEWNGELAMARAQLERENLRSDDIDRIGRAVEAVRQAATQARDEEHGKAEQIRGLLATLGPPPERGQPPETPDILARRKTFNGDLARYASRVKQAELTLAQADELARAVTQTRQTRFAARLFRHGPSPLSPAVWTTAVPELGAVLSRLAAAPLERWREVGAEGVPTGAKLRDVVAALAALVAAVAIGWPLRRMLLSRWGRDPTIAQPEFGRRALAAAAGGAARGLLPALAIGALALVFIAGDPSGLFALLVRALAIAAVSVILVTTLAWAALAPDAPAWRLLPVDAAAARLIYHRIVLAICVGGVNIVFFRVARAAGASDALRALLPSIVDTVLAGVLLSLLPSRLWQQATSVAAADATLPEPEDAAHLSPDAAPSRPTASPMAADVPGPGAALGGRWWLVTRMLAGAVAVTVPFWVLFGYVRFASYLNNALVASAAAISLLLLLRLLWGEALRRLVGEPERQAPAMAETRSAAPPRPAALQRWLALDDQTVRYVDFWLSLLVDLALIALGLLLLALILGVRPGDLGAALGDIFAGITIGKIRLSPSDLVVGLILFAVVLGITRLIQRFIDERVLARTRVDSGVRNSLVAGLGYIGFFIAALAGISTAGLDLSNLAIIAGALSVGIGFGLQNIVNNFVSGLILLVERPIKVGDAVSISGRDGVVRRISVRATEIETAQRASIIIPNSELLSSAVTNLTHRDTLGRVDVAIGVAYGSDTEQVRKLLLDCAAADYRVLRHPAPQVLFRDFGDSALRFELRCFVGAPADMLWVPSDLRFAIDKACRELGIEMPFPQREIRIRNIAEIAAALRQGKPQADDG